MTALSPTITLNNGVTMPALGLGVMDAGADGTTPATTEATALWWLSTRRHRPSPVNLHNQEGQPQ